MTKSGPSSGKERTLSHALTMPDSVLYWCDPDAVTRGVVECPKCDGSGDRVAVYHGWRADGTPTVRLLPCCRAPESPPSPPPPETTENRR
jgi:hypothetical protein